MRTVYMDHAATTPLDARVLEAMMPYLTEQYGNASSVHAFGRRARFAVEDSREKVASLLGAEPGEIVFTSGGTESNNTVLKGTRGTIVTSTAEHESILRAAGTIEKAGRRVVLIDPSRTGAVTARDVADHLSEDVGLVSMMHANNEVGTLSPISEIVEACRARAVAVHCDAVQTAGFGLLRFDELGVDFATLSGHKFYGPKGIGVLFVRGGADIAPLLAGGAQERRRRGGTENVPAIVGLAEALRLALETAPERRRRAADLRDRLLRGLREILGGRAVVNTPVGLAPVAPHILNIALPPVDGEPVDGEMLLLNLDMEGVHVSAGSACMSGTIEPSHVLTAIGLGRETASAAIRFSVGKGTTEDDVDYAVEAVARVVHRMMPSFASG